MLFTDKELAMLISDVETEFSSYLTKAETTLAKSEDSAPAKKDAKKPEADESEEAPEQEAAPEQSEEAPAPTDEAPAAPADDQAPPMDAAPADEGHGYDDEDMAHMSEMYSSMSRPELIAHHDAVKAALDAMGAQEQAAPPAMDQAAAPAQDAMPPEMMQKSEKDVAVTVNSAVLVASAETDLLKSELASKTGEISELKKSVEVMTSFIEKLISKKAAPTGKAITSLETINKSEDGNSKAEDFSTLSKQEITARLNKKASDPKLEKSDRDLINRFYESGTINLNGISHLLK